MERHMTRIDRLRTFRTPVGFWMVLLLSFFFGTVPQGRAESDAKQTPGWEITADQITYNQLTDTYTAEGDVRISREGRVLTADKALVNQTSQRAWAMGDVRLVSGQDTLTGRRLELNLKDETGALTDGNVFLAQNHLYLKSDQILKTGPQTYFARNASVTTCDGPNPDWHITGKDLKVTIGGYGFVRHAAFWADGLPIMYTPYLFFPVNRKRQTGLLAPEFGYSDRKGFDYLQPFYWAVNDSMDATVMADYMSERGLRLGAEYRYVASERSWGTLMADGFDDRQVDDGLDAHSERYGYPGDAYLRTNRDRYWVRGKANQELPWKMTAKVDVDVVSDQDYLQDFKTGPFGFEKTQAYFLRTFGRDIDDYTDPFRKNQLNINRLWTTYAFNANVRWYQDAVRDRPEGSATPLQNLPEITMDGIKQKIDGSPVYYGLMSSYTNLYQENGDRGQRADVYPRLYYPTRLFNAVSVEPSAGIRQTVWYMDHYENAAGDERREHSRTLYDFKLDTSTDFYRVYACNTAGWDRIKHDLRPQIIYQYLPEEDQSDFPQFDTLDRIEARNLITFALTNTLIARKSGPAQSQGPSAEYIPFLWFRLEEGFDINKSRDDDPRPFSDLFGEVDLRPGRYVQLNGDFTWRPYDGQFYGYNMAVSLWDLRGDRLGLEYRFSRETDEFQAVKSINANAVWQVTRRWQMRGKYESDLERRQLIETGFGVSYISQCWGVDLDLMGDQENNYSFSVLVRLAGLGNLGA